LGEEDRGKGQGQQREELGHRGNSWGTSYTGGG
jgi:hypothetical protein